MTQRGIGRRGSGCVEQFSQVGRHVTELGGVVVRAEVELLGSRVHRQQVDDGGRRGPTNIHPGFSAPKLKTDILGQTIPAGRKTAPTAAQNARRAPRKLMFLPVAKGGKKKK